MPLFCLGVAAGYLALGVIFGGFLRRRHDAANKYVFWCFAALFGSSTIVWGLLAWYSFRQVQGPLGPVFGVAVLGKMFCICLTAIVTTRATPTAMKVPSITQIFERQISAGVSNAKL